MVQKLLIPTLIFNCLNSYAQIRAEKVPLLKDEEFKVEELTKEKFNRGESFINITASDGGRLQTHVLVQSREEDLDLVAVIRSLPPSERNRLPENIRKLTRFELRQFALGRDN